MFLRMGKASHQTRAHGSPTVAMTTGIVVVLGFRRKEPRPDRHEDGWTQGTNSTESRQAIWMDLPNRYSMRD